MIPTNYLLLDQRHFLSGGVLVALDFGGLMSEFVSDRHPIPLDSSMLKSSEVGSLQVFCCHNRSYAKAAVFLCFLFLCVYFVL